MTFIVFFLTVFLWLPICSISADAQDKSSVPIADFSQPLLFTYGSWQHNSQTENGQTTLHGTGLTGQGGGGSNVSLDLSQEANFSPIIRLRVGAGNTLKTLRLMLRDTSGKTATYDFSLPAPSPDFVTVAPVEGAPLAQPTSTDTTGMPDLAHIIQWQIIGDWSLTTPDLEIQSITAAPPTEAIKAARKIRAQRDAAQQKADQSAADARRAKYGKVTRLSPTVTSVGLVGPDMMAITIQAGHIIPGSLHPYQPLPGDSKNEKKDDSGKVTQVLLVRGGQEVGWLIGPQRDQLVTYEQEEGDPLLEDTLTDVHSYTLTSTDDPHYTHAQKPTAVYRKSKPTDWAQPSHIFAMQHILYLKLPHTLIPGRHYHLHLGNLNVQTPDVRFGFDPLTQRSEAVHVNQIGYRPDDPVKRAFLSVWLGTGRAYRYPSSLRFHLVSTATGKIVYTGLVTLVLDADAKEVMWRTDNFSKTNIYRLDFSPFQTPGRYRVSVDGIGCSYPFSISRTVWQHAFQVQMRGLLNERSGPALGPPYTKFQKPPDFSPDDGDNQPILQSSHSILDPGGDSQAALAAGATTTPVPEAWGGYHDAGDWNPRRITHMRVTMAQMEIYEMFPDYFRTLKWNIPQTIKAPDILQEALFELSLFHRLQLPNGAMRYGIETDGDPIDGEVSWLQSMPAYVYAPDLWSSYVYAAAASRFARVIAPYDAAVAKTYRDSALDAMSWAEAEYAKRKEAGTLASLPGAVKSDRNLAALEVYFLTGDHHWHDVFSKDTLLRDPALGEKSWGDSVQRDTAFLYARLPDTMADADWKKNARHAIEAQAHLALDYAGGNAFNLTTPDKGKPMFLGFYSSPDAVELVRAHFLTGKREYLAGAVQATQFQSGDNPSNMTYTTGLGANPPRHPLHLDSRRTGQAAPEGLTVYGNFDFVSWPDQQWALWPIQLYLSQTDVPSAWDWPISEAYYDIFLYPAINEFTVDMWSPNVYVWGYLAARR